MNRLFFLKETSRLLCQQGCRALSEIETGCGHRYSSCRYRTPEGLKCAIGIHIPDEQYDGILEALGKVRQVWKSHRFLLKAIEEKFGEITLEDVSFLDKVQRIFHDINIKEDFSLANAKRLFPEEF